MKYLSVVEFGTLPKKRHFYSSDARYNFQLLTVNC